MRYQGFVGPSNSTRSRNVDFERSINYYAKIIGAGTPAVDRNFYSCPGLAPFVVLPEGPVRQVFYQDGRAFAVAGVHFYELFASQTFVIRGTVAAGATPATIVSNGTSGHQVFIVSGGRGYIFDLVSNVFTTIVAAGFPLPCLVGGFIDGFFIALKGQSNQFNLSALEDGLTWDPLSVAQVSESSNQLLSMIMDHREAHFFGSKTTEIWYNAGDAGFPLAPIQGAFIEAGIIAPFSAAKVDNTVLWLGGDERGAGVVWRLDGYTPKRISTHAIETLIQTLPIYSNAIAWTYQDEGHSFYVLSLPNAETTPVFDLASNEWHERPTWNDAENRWEPFLGRCHAFAFGRHLIGSRINGAIYQMSLALHDEQVVP